LKKSPAHQHISNKKAARPTTNKTNINRLANNQTKKKKTYPHTLIIDLIGQYWEMGKLKQTKPPHGDFTNKSMRFFLASFTTQENTTNQKIKHASQFQYFPHPPNKQKQSKKKKESKNTTLRVRGKLIQTQHTCNCSFD